MWTTQINKSVICHKYKKKQVQYIFCLQLTEKVIQKDSQSYTQTWWVNKVLKETIMKLKPLS